MSSRVAQGTGWCYASAATLRVAAAPDALSTRIEMIQRPEMHRNAVCEAPVSINQPNSAGVTNEPKSVPE